jgi:uncharacterized Zn finger protein
MDTKEPLPPLTEADIRTLASAQSFERGTSYFHDGAICDPVRQGMELHAACEGSQYDPYHVSVTLTIDGIGKTSCTCPYDWGGLCKHVVAFLLTYVHTPQAFRVLPPLATLLAHRSTADLITIIGTMLEREPSLMAVVELSATIQQDNPLDREASRKRVRRALCQDTLRTMERELQALQDSADRLAQAGEWRNAGTVYEVLLTETVSQYGNELRMLDEDGAIALMTDACAAGLSTCLRGGTLDNTTRRAWLEALLNAVLTDIPLGGIDLAPSAREVVLAHATVADWAWIEPRIRVQIQQSRDWRREALVHFLSAGQVRQGRDADAAALIRELGTPEQQVFLLVQEGKIDEALRRMPQLLTGKPGLITQFADALMAVGADTAAVTLVTKQAQSRGELSRCTDWLVRYYREHGTPREAIAWQQKAFLQQPSVEVFKALRQASRRVGIWDQVRIEVLTALEHKRHIGPLIDIALHEGEVSRALALLPRVSQAEGRDYRAEVAHAAEKAYPQEAIELYKEMVARAIGRRRRRTYQRTVQYLKRIKTLYARLKIPSQWEAYYQALRAHAVHLPALHDEWHKARL